MSQQQWKLIKDEVNRLKRIDSTNELFFDLKIHVRYLNYRVKEFYSENVLRLTKFEWIAAGYPFEPMEDLPDK